MYLNIRPLIISIQNKRITRKNGVCKHDRPWSNNVSKHNSLGSKHNSLGATMFLFPYIYTKQKNHRERMVYLNTIALE